MLRDDVLGIRPEAVHRELTRADLLAWASRPAPDTVAVRHTVGLLDPIVAGDVPADGWLRDGLPQTLEECVRAHGLRHFKLKVGGQLGDDVDRLTRIAATLDRLIPDAYLATLDGNEQYKTMADFAALVEAIERTPALARLWRSTAFIEQPLDRAIALDAAATEGLAALGRRVPIIIDESDGDLEAFPRALALGYRGVSTKNCKGIIKSFLNRSLVERRNAGRPEPARLFMSAEDLTNVPVVPVQQDLATVRALGITHVERNGHHYVRGLAHCSPRERAAALRHHADLYTGDEREAWLRIENGRLRVGSLATPGYGVAFEPGSGRDDPARALELRVARGGRVGLARGGLVARGDRGRLGQERVLGQRARGERGGPVARVDPAQQLVEELGEMGLVAHVERRRHVDLVARGAHRAGLRARPLPAGQHPGEMARGLRGVAAGLDDHAPPEARLLAHLDLDLRGPAAQDEARGVAAAGRRGDLPARGGAHGHAAEPVGHLRVAEDAQRVALHRAAQLGRHPARAGDAGEDVHRHARGPAARGEQRRRVARRGVGVEQPLGLIDLVGGDVHRPAALDARVEEPPRAAERRAVHALLEVMDALLLDGGLRRVGREAAEDLGSSTSRLTRRPIVSRRPVIISRAIGPPARLARISARSAGSTSHGLSASTWRPEAWRRRITRALPPFFPASTTTSPGRSTRSWSRGSAESRTRGRQAVGRSARVLKRSTSARKSSSSGPAVA